MKIAITFRSLFFVGALASLFCFLGTYFLQYVLALEPCPLCYLQRGALFLVMLTFWVGVLHNAKQTGRLIYSGFVLLFSTLGAALAIRQLWLQYVSPVEEQNCLAGFEQMLALMPLWEVLQETLSGSPECSKIDFTFLNLSLPAWSLLVFIGFVIYTIALGWLQIKRRI